MDFSSYKTEGFYDEMFASDGQLRPGAALLAARYVSGYLVTQPPPGRLRLRGADASHAWLSVYCPELGWIDIDPTNNVLPGSGHIRVAFGRDYSDVSPIKGVVLGGGEHTLRVAVDVVPSPAHAPESIMTPE